jgi:hypothetical protein
MLLSPTNRGPEAQPLKSALVVPASKWLKPQAFINTRLHRKSSSTTPHLALPRNAGPGRWTTGCWMLDAGRCRSYSSCPPCTSGLPLEDTPNALASTLLLPASSKMEMENRPNCPLSAVPLLPPPRYASACDETETLCRISQCAEHGSLYPALYCPDGPSRIEI